jgi:ribosomal-protein-alanine N-acetyltransferase
MPLNKTDVHEIFNLNTIWNTTFWTFDNIYEEIIKEENLNFKLFYNNKNILGYIFSTIIIDELNILNICIHPDFLNQGFGFILLKYVLDRGFILGATSAFLEVRSSNKAALHLYEKCCFKKNFIRKKYYFDGEDAVLMSLKIK